MKTTRRYFSNIIGFNDILFNLLLFFVVMMVLMMLMIVNPEKEISPVENKAEFLMTLEWNHDSDDDVDIWARDPSNRVLFFRYRETGLMHLDRDDLGKGTDSYETSVGQYEFLDINREILTIRGIVPGWYTFNIQYYRKDTKYKKTSIIAIVEVIKLNPFKMITKRKIKLSIVGEEYTVVNFRLDEDGNVIEQNSNFESLFQQSLISEGAGPG